MKLIEFEKDGEIWIAPVECWGDDCIYPFAWQRNGHKVMAAGCLTVRTARDLTGSNYALASHSSIERGGVYGLRLRTAADLLRAQSAHQQIIIHCGGRGIDYDATCAISKDQIVLIPRDRSLDPIYENANAPASLYWQRSAADTISRLHDSLRELARLLREKRDSAMLADSALSLINRHIDVWGDDDEI